MNKAHWISSLDIIESLCGEGDSNLNALSNETEIVGTPVSSPDVGKASVVT